MRRLGGEAPVLASGIDSLSATDAVDPAAGGQQHAALPEHARQVSKSGLDVDDHLQRLATDDAIEALGRHVVRAREIGHDRRLRVAGDGVQHVALLRANGLTAAVFLTVGPPVAGGDRLPSFEGGPMLSWAEIPEMQRAGIAFGAHTLTHPDLARIPEREVETEMRANRKR
jgi:Polysaccharide deacetylase